MPTRIFATQQLIDWGLHYPDECDLTVHSEELGQVDFKSRRRVTFRAPDDGKLWAFEYEYNPGAGWDEIIGSSSWIRDQTVEPLLPSFEATEVEARKRTITEYVPVDDKG